LSHLNIAEKRLPQDGRIKVRIDDAEVDIRVSVIPMLHGEAVVMRLLRQNSTLRGLAELGMDSANWTVSSASSVCRTASSSSPARPAAAKPPRFTPR
jgi:type II secretory ATPase GspE/PulE/Tfp pilus assembly ATPase PilB-like protein